jgi:formylglycine-generating enzyme required for sulfatase activity
MGQSHSDLHPHQPLEEQIFQRLSEWQRTYPQGDGPRDPDLEGLIYQFLYRELRGVAAVLPGLGPQANNLRADVSCRFTNVLNKAFLKIIEKYPDQLMQSKSRKQLTGYVSRTMSNLMLTHYRRKGTFKKIVEQLGLTESEDAQISTALAAIESRLATEVQGKDVDAAAQLASDRLVEALEQYDQAVALKQQALAEQYLPTSTRVKGIEATISQAESTLAKTLKELDKQYASRFDQLRGIITAAESDYRALLKEVAPTHKDAVELKARIDGLKLQQILFSGSRDRYSGKQVPRADELASLCRSQLREYSAERQRAKLARLWKEGKVPTAADMKFVPIGSGKFSMGTESGPSDEQPVHEVTITKPFYAGKHEVTVGQVLWWLNSGETIDGSWVLNGGEQSPVIKSSGQWLRNTGSEFGKYNQQPMVAISWHGAKAFCAWCTKVDPAFTYRLPTEAEWEYMARAGSKTKFPWGDKAIDYQANISSRNRTTMVGGYSPNAWGLHDIVGNVWEWCEDTYDSSFYSTSAATQSDPVNRGSGTRRVVRSGSWAWLEPVGSSSRYAYDSNKLDSTIGFRVIAE